MCFLIQDPAGIFELVEVVGNGTYGQVYKVGVSLHLFACQSLKRERGHWNRKRHYFCFSKDAKSTRHPHVFVLVSGLDYLWFSFCFVSTRFSKAYIISVHLFWSTGGSSFIFSDPHPSQIFCACYTLCNALIRPCPSVHDSLQHADRLIRHWVGGVSLRICAQHCPAGLLLE